jgi:hypothetical protein
MRFSDLSPRELWHSNSPEPWDALIGAYWRQPTVRRTLQIHKELEHLDREEVLGRAPEDWYQWLRDSFMPWKFEAHRVPVRQRDIDGQWATASGREDIERVRRTMVVAMERGGFEEAVSLAKSIKGIGVSAGSAMVTLLFPGRCATGDDRVVGFLRAVPDLPEHQEILGISDPKQLRICEATVISRIAGSKAADLNGKFGVQCWTPRLVERSLWTYDSDCGRK